jgi:hypothetical protein
MNKPLQFFGCILLMSCFAAKEATAPAKPQVFILDVKALESNKSRILSKDKAALSAYKQLIKEADKGLQFGPVSVMEKKNNPPSGDKHDYMSLAPYHWPDPSKADGLPYIRKDGETNPEVKEYKDKEYLPKLCEVVHTLALAYYFSEEGHYAEHASRLIRTWFLDTATRMNPNLNFGQGMKGHNTGRGAGMIDTRHLVKVVDAVGLLKQSKYWKKADQEGMKKWFGDFIVWMQTSPVGLDEKDSPNNHGAWYDAQRLAMSLFIGDRDLSREIVLSAQQRLDSQMNNDGFFPKELERTISLHYSVFVMDAFFHIAQMAEEAGMDFWNYTSPTGKSLKKAFEALRPFLLQEKDWTGKQIKPFNPENGFMILLEGEKRFGCKNCREGVRLLAGDKSERLIINLLY